MSKTRNKPEPWPPRALTLPDLTTLEELSQPGGGPVGQSRLIHRSPGRRGPSGEAGPAVRFPGRRAGQRAVRPTMRGKPQ